MVSRSSSQQIKENFSAPAMSETIRMTVHARYRTRWQLSCVHLCHSLMGRVVSDDRWVSNLGHHTRRHVIEVVAVKRPAARIVGIKGDGDAAHRWHQDSISHGTCEWSTVYRDHLESVAVKVHRMRHHRVIHHLD